MSDNPVTLDFLAEQMRRLQAELRILRDDMDVVAAMVRRLDHTIAPLETNQALMLDELRAMHSATAQGSSGARPRRTGTVRVAHF